MTRSSRTPQRLVVGDETFLYSVRHEHSAEAGRYEDCRDILTVRRPGAIGRLRLVFEGSQDHLVPDVAPGAAGRLDLYEPATVRALLDEAVARGCKVAADATEQLDGWTLCGTASAAGAGHE